MLDCIYEGKKYQWELPDMKISPFGNINETLYSPLMSFDMVNFEKKISNFIADYKLILSEYESELKSAHIEYVVIGIAIAINWDVITQEVIDKLKLMSDSFNEKRKDVFRRHEIFNPIHLKKYKTCFGRQFPHRVYTELVEVFRLFCSTSFHKKRSAEVGSQFCHQIKSPFKK